MTGAAAEPGTRLLPDLSRVPEELRACRQWVVWRWEEVSERRTKVLYSPLPPRRRAKSNAPETWGAFEEAVRCWQEFDERFDGLGFVFSEADPYVGIDLDDCLDAETGEVAPWAAELLAELPTYAEISPRGQGIKVFARGGPLPQTAPGRTGRRNASYESGAVEMYDRTRFFTVTGAHYAPSPLTVEDCTAGAAEVYRRVFPPRAATSAPAAPRGPVSLDDAELLELARGSERTGYEFSALYDRGDFAAAGNGSHSEADRHLCRLLGWWCQGDAGRVDRLFRSSALMREKWERRDYAERTLDSALGSLASYYDPTCTDRGPGDDEAPRNEPRGEDVSDAPFPEPPFEDRVPTDTIPAEARRFRRTKTSANGRENGNGRHVPEEAEPAEAPAALLKPAPFPLAVLPGPFRALAEEGAAALPCPPEFIGVPALVGAGAAIGTTHVLRVKPSWSEGPRLYACIVSPPGSRKSPALALAMAPLHERETQYEDDYRRDLADHKGQLAAYEIELQQWRGTRRTQDQVQRMLGTAADAPERPSDPVRRKIVTTDPTLEKVCQILHENPRGLLFVRDELTGWVRSMDAYRGGRGGDRQAWLSFWNGAFHAVDRKADGSSLVIPRPFVNVVGCLPPDVLRDLTDERQREDGFVHRILFSYPECPAVVWSEASIAGNVRDRYAEVFEALFRLRGQMRDEREEPQPLVFTPAGRELWAEFAAGHYREASLMDPEDPLAGPWAKLDGYCARLSLVLHLCRLVCGEAHTLEVDEGSVMRAAALAEYFKRHAERVYHRLRQTDDDVRAERVLHWVARREGGAATAREVLRSHVAQVATGEEARRLLLRLQQRGYGHVESAGRKDSGVFRIHPSTLEQLRGEPPP